MGRTSRTDQKIDERIEALKELVAVDKKEKEAIDFRIALRLNSITELEAIKNTPEQEDQ